METKTCSSCLSSKPLSDYSYRNKRPVAWCKSCVAQKTRTWYKAHREKALLNAKNWVTKNRRRSNEIKKKWEVAHKEYKKAWLVDYRKRKKSKSLEMAKITCIKCGRLTIDTRYPKCPDCRMIENQIRIRKIRLGF